MFEKKKLKRRQTLKSSLCLTTKTNIEQNVMAAQQYQKQFGATAQTTITKIQKLPPIKEDVTTLKLRVQEV